MRVRVATGTRSASLPPILNAAYDSGDGYRVRGGGPILLNLSGHRLNVLCRLGCGRTPLSSGGPGQSGLLGHQVIFRTLGGPATTFRVYIGSCAQWHGFGATTLYLGHSGAQDIGAVRLLP